MAHEDLLELDDGWVIVQNRVLLVRRSCREECGVLQELSVQLEIIPRLVDLHLIERDIFQLQIEAGHTLVDARLVREECVNCVCLLQLCRAEVMEVEAVE